MPKLEYAIVAQADDAYYEGGCYNSALTLKVSHAYGQQCAVRFVNVALAQGETIERAYIKMKAAGAHDGSASFDFYGDDVDDSIAWSGANCNPDNRTKTTATVRSGVPVSVQNDWIEFDDIANIIQEIVNRGSWASGNALSVMCFYIDGPSGGFNCYSFDNGDAPELIIHTRSKFLGCII